MMIYKRLFCLIYLLIISDFGNSQTNDDFNNATELTSISDYCSVSGDFTTIAATADLGKPSNWSNGPNANLWYKFQATTTTVSVLLTPETMKYGRLSLHDASSVEIVSVNEGGVSAEIGLSA